MATRTKNEADSFALQNGNGEELLTKQQIAESLKLSSRSIDRKISRGEFPRGMKIGALVRWPKSAIEQWVHDQWTRRCETEARKLRVSMSKGIGS